LAPFGRRLVVVAEGRGRVAARCDTGLIVPRLYYMPRTRSSRVLWLLAELGAPCELVKLAPEDRSSAEHRARHPLGRVPALELDDGTVMFESAAICLAAGRPASRRRLDCPAANARAGARLPMGSVRE
jgi:hypothetical protein